MTTYKILVVDDVIENLKSIIAIIEKNHPEYQIYQANDGRKALKLSEIKKPDIIISDWDMPEMDGIQLIRALMSDPVLRQIPVIITTGIMVASEDLKSALKEGAVDYLRKPVNSTELLARMHAALTISNYQKQIIKEKESKIVENAILSNQVNQFLRMIADNLRNALENNNSIRTRELAMILEKIENRINSKCWQHYTLAFNNLHPDFEKRLVNKHPSITAAELKLSTLVRLGFSIKEISELMFHTPESIRVSRSRLRKKMELDMSQNLHSYLSGI